MPFIHAEKFLDEDCVDFWIDFIKIDDVRAFVERAFFVYEHICHNVLLATAKDEADIF